MRPPLAVLGGSRAQRKAIRDALAVVPEPMLRAARRQLVVISISDSSTTYENGDARDGDSVAGSYLQDMRTAFVRSTCTSWTIWHEIGHALDAALAVTPGDRKWSTGDGFAFWQQAVEDNDFPSDYAQTSPQENFAERFAEYIAASTGHIAARLTLHRGGNIRAVVMQHTITQALEQKGLPC